MGKEEQSKYTRCSFCKLNIHKRKKYETVFSLNTQSCKGNGKKNIYICTHSIVRGTNALHKSTPLSPLYVFEGVICVVLYTMWGGSAHGFVASGMESLP